MQRHNAQGQRHDGHPNLTWPADELYGPPRLAFGTREMAPLDRVVDEVEQRDAELAQIVHDLKNPLATIALEMCLLEERLDGEACGDMRVALVRVAQNIAYLERLIHDILDACASELGELVLHRRPTDLAELLARVIERAVPTRDHDRVVLDARHALTVSIDEHRIERVVANLLQNALKHAPRNTGIAVRLSLLENRVRVDVIDQGPGLRERDFERLFERFQRAGDLQQEGTGLGLFVSRRIVEAHGGAIGVHSMPHVGCRFYFEIPVA